MELAGGLAAADVPIIGSGATVVSKAWELDCPDWQQRLAAGRAPIRDLPLDRERADRAVAIFKKLRIFNVPGQPSFADVAPQFIFDIVAAIFGAFDKATGERMIRGYFDLIPKKNAKTTYGAGILMTAAIINKRPRARLIFTGPSHTVAGEAYDAAKGMIALDREGYLQKRFYVREHLQTIEDRVISETQLLIQTFSASIVTGGVPSVVLIDEVHLLGRVAKAAAIIQQLTGGMVSVPEAFWMMITTQSFEPPAGVFKANLKVARGIRDGTIKGVDTLPILYEFSEEQQKTRSFWDNPDNWPLVNPNHGRSTFVPRLVKDLAKAREEGEDAVRIWYSQHLNIEMGLGLHDDAWAGAECWEGAVDKTITFQSLLERCEVVDPGIDGGGLDDLLGLTFVGREKGTGRLLTWSKAWAHKKVLKQRQDIAPRLKDFEKVGELVIVSTMEAAFAEVADLVAQVHQRGLIDRVCVDRYGVAGIKNALEAAGIGEDLLEGVHQGFVLSGTIKDTEGLLSDGLLWHAGQDLMAWCIGNAKVSSTGNAISITKQVSGTAKIDPVMALFCAMSRMRLNPEPADGTLPEDYEVTVWA